MMDGSFELGEGDIALIIREDGELELLMPEIEEGDKVPDNTLILSAFMIGFNEPEFRAYMLSLFSKEWRQSLG